MNFPKMRKWIGRSMWALMDQGLFAASNFVLNVLLARWLPEAEYGEFSVAFTVFLFLGVVYSSLMVEPMFVMGPGRYEGAFPGYLRALGRLHWRNMGWAIAGLGLVLSFFYWGGGVFMSLAALSLCSPVIFEQWLLRRACYIRVEPQIAAVGGILYCGVMVGGVAALNHFDRLTPVTGVMMIAIASAPASAWIRWRLLRRLEEPRVEVSVTEVREVHWNYGKWAVASSVLGWIPGNIYMLLLPFWHGSEAAGAFRAGFNIGLPMLQLQATAAMLILPTLVRARENIGYQRRVLGLSVLLAGASAGYVLIVWVAGERMFGLLYGDKFVGHAQDVWMIVLPVVPGAAMAVLSCGVRALEAPDKVFKAYVASAISCGVIGLPLTYRFGEFGAAWGITISSVVCAAALLIQLRLLAPRTTPSVEVVPT